ncbi:MAG: DUF1302 domain-containing protein [Proteobacteria bacterium]|nr:DUF1302 domain-containing protein [Pseudomonadota bacterium]
MSDRIIRSGRLRRAAPFARALAVALGAGLAVDAGAFEIDTGNPELKIHWDQTLRYNFGKRVQAQDPAILANPNKDDGDRNFAKGSTVTNRIDLLSELDIVYKDDLGLRLSAAGWADQAYTGRLDNRSVATSNHLVNGEQALGLSPYTRRYSRGPSGEWLDAFVFGSFDLGGKLLSVRAGQHSIYWGESLLDPVNGIAYGQAPLDLNKAYSTPGIEVKELFRPVPQLSATLQATPELSLAAQYLFKWRDNRFPESGSYLMDIDPLQHGGDAYILAPGVFFTQGRAITPKNGSEWGLAARWSPRWLDGTAGLYVRRFSDKMPQLVVNAGTGEYLLNYAAGVQLYGLSLAKQVAGISVGADLNLRRNMPLNNDGALVMSAADLPARGDTLAPRGKTLHGVVNALAAVGKTPLFDAASWVAELSWTRLLSVQSDPQGSFTGRAGYDAIDRVSKDFFGIGLKFTPKWFQVFPGADLSTAFAYSTGLAGNSAVLGGGNKRSGSFSVDLGLDWYQRHRFDLQYVGYFGDRTIDPASGAVTVVPGNGAIRDRGAVYLTFKTTF